MILATLAIGMALLVALVITQQRTREPLHPRLGSRWTSVLALPLVAVSIGSLTLITSTAGLWPMRIALFVLGIGIAHIFVPAQATAFTNIARVDTGAASMLFNALRQLGSALGVAAITTALTIASSGHSQPGDPYAYHVAFAIAALIALLGALVAMTIRRA